MDDVEGRDQLGEQDLFVWLLRALGAITHLLGRDKVEAIIEVGLQVKVKRIKWRELGAESREYCCRDTRFRFFLSRSFSIQTHLM